MFTRIHGALPRCHPLGASGMAASQRGDHRGGGTLAPPLNCQVKWKTNKGDNAGYLWSKALASSLEDTRIVDDWYACLVSGRAVGLPRRGACMPFYVHGGRRHACTCAELSPTASAGGARNRKRLLDGKLYFRVACSPPWAWLVTRMRAQGTPRRTHRYRPRTHCQRRCWPPSRAPSQRYTRRGCVHTHGNVLMPPRPCHAADNPRQQPRRHAHGLRCHAHAAVIAPCNAPHACSLFVRSTTVTPMAVQGDPWPHARGTGHSHRPCGMRMVCGATITASWFAPRATARVLSLCTIGHRHA